MGIRALLRLQIRLLRSAADYRGDFWIGIVGAVLQQVAGLVLLWAVFAAAGLIGGWPFSDVLVLQGVVILPVGLCEIATNGAWRLRDEVRTGQFDIYLVRPVPVILQQLLHNGSLHGFGNVVLGSAVLIVGVVNSPASRSLFNLAFLASAILLGFVINTCINVITNTVAFWQPGGHSAIPTLISFLRDFSKYPLELYDEPLGRVLIMVVPYMHIAYWPTAIAVGQRDLSWLALLPLAVSAALLVAVGLAWRAGLRRYESAG